MKGFLVNSNGIYPCDVNGLSVDFGSEDAFVSVTVDGKNESVSPQNIQSVETMLNFNVVPDFPALLVSKADHRTLSMRTGVRYRKPRTKNA